MPAPKGNQFWKLRDKHGKNKSFESPEQLSKYIDEYFNECVNN